MAIAELMVMFNDINFPLPKINDLVKIRNENVNNGRERFWVKVVRILDNIFQGIIDNDLVDTTHYDCGDKIIFKLEDILDIYPHKD
jgi:uncharacterized protein YegJ (DUF2314 family)